MDYCISGLAQRLRTGMTGVAGGGASAFPASGREPGFLDVAYTLSQDFRTMFEDFNYHRDHAAERMERQHLYEEKEEHCISARKLERLDREFRILHSLTVDLIGQAPQAQRSVVEYAYSKYANQDEFPTVRDVVQQILRLPAS